MSDTHEQNNDDGGKSRSTVGLEVAKCVECGDDRYEIQLLRVSMRNKLYVVECGGCHRYLLPVVVDYFEPQEKIYEKCEAAWNSANKTSNVLDEQRATEK